MRRFGLNRNGLPSDILEKNNFTIKPDENNGEGVMMQGDTIENKTRLKYGMDGHVS